MSAGEFQLVKRFASSRGISTNVASRAATLHSAKCLALGALVERASCNAPGFPTRGAIVAELLQERAARFVRGESGLERLASKSSTAKLTAILG